VLQHNGKYLRCQQCTDQFSWVLVQTSEVNEVKNEEGVVTT